MWIIWSIFFKLTHLSFSVWLYTYVHKICLYFIGKCVMCSMSIKLWQLCLVCSFWTPCVSMHRRTLSEGKQMGRFVSMHNTNLNSETDDDILRTLIIFLMEINVFKVCAHTQKWCWPLVLVYIKLGEFST